MKKIVEIAHDYLNEIMNEKSVGIDFTCGQGNDTLFMAQHCDKVYAYDIQLDAINQTKELLEKNGITNVCLKHKSHELFDEDIKCFDCGIFNLGYLPHGDTAITTIGEVVVSTLGKTLSLLSNGGRIVLVLYPGFEEGKEESRIVENYCESLPSKKYDVGKFIMMNRKSCPYIIIVDKH